MYANLVLKKWGNSIGAVFPKELIDENGFKPDQEISVYLLKKADLRNAFGSLETKETGQQLKNFAREGSQ